LHKNPTNLEVEVSGKASNKGEKSEYGNEKKLETVGVKSKDKGINLNIVTDGGYIRLGLRRSGKESGDLCALVTLDDGKSVLVYVFLASGECGGTLLGSLGVELGVTLDLKTRVSEVGYGVRLAGCLVSSSGDVERNLGCLLRDGRVSSIGRRSSNL
jgi:hypothetical protein